MYTECSFPAGNKSYSPVCPPPGEHLGRESFSGGVDDAAIVLDGNGKAPELESKLLYTSNGSKGYDVYLRLGQVVTVHHDGDTFTTKSRQESILKTLRRLDIVPGPLEMVGIDFTDSGVEITVSSDLAYYEHVVEEVAFETVRVANPQM